MLQALDAVGVHLIVIAVVVMDDALKVAALPHLLLHMHTRWFTIACHGNNINNNDNDNILMTTTMTIMIMIIVLIMIIMIIDNNNAETITMITEDSNTDNSNNGKR